MIIVDKNKKIEDFENFTFYAIDYYGDKVIKCTTGTKISTVDTLPFWFDGNVDGMKTKLSGDCTEEIVIFIAKIDLIYFLETDRFEKIFISKEKAEQALHNKLKY